MNEMCTRFTINKHIRHEIEAPDSLEKRVLIIPDHDGRPDVRNVLFLSSTSLWIWEALQKGQTYSEILKEMCYQYNVDNEQADKDLSQFLSELIQKGYISIVNKGDTDG